MPSPESGKATTTNTAPNNATNKDEKRRRRKTSGGGDQKSPPLRASQTVFSAKHPSPIDDALAESAAAAAAASPSEYSRHRNMTEKSPRQSLSIPEKHLAFDYNELMQSTKQDAATAAAATAITLQIALDQQKNYAYRLLGITDDVEEIDAEEAARRAEEDEERVKQQRAAGMLVENPQTYEVQDRIYRDLRAKAVEVGRFIADMDNTHRELATRLDKVRPTSEVQAMLNTLLNSLNERDLLFTLCLDEQQRESQIVLQVQPGKAETSGMRRKVINAVYRYDGINRRSGAMSEVGETPLPSVRMVEFEDVRKQVYENYLANNEVERAVLKIVSTLVAKYETDLTKTVELNKTTKERLTFLERNIEHLLRFDGSVDFRHLATLTDGIVPSALLKRASELYDEDNADSPLSKPTSEKTPEPAALTLTVPTAAPSAQPSTTGENGRPSGEGADETGKSEEVTESDLKNLTFDELVALNLDMRKMKRENVDLRRRLTKGDKLYRLVCEQEVESRTQCEKSEKTMRRMQRDYLRSRRRLEEASFYIDNQLWQNGEEFHFTDEDKYAAEEDEDDFAKLDEKLAKLHSIDDASDADAAAQKKLRGDDEDDDEDETEVDDDDESGEDRPPRGRALASFTIPDIADYTNFFDRAIALAPNESFKAQTLDIKTQLTKLIGAHQKFKRWLTSSKQDVEVLHSAIWLVLSYFEKEAPPSDGSYRRLLDAFEQLATTFKDNQTFVKTAADGGGKTKQKQKLADYGTIVTRLVSAYNERLKIQQTLDENAIDASPSTAHLSLVEPNAGASSAMDSEQMLKRMHQIRRRGEELEKANQVLNRKVGEIEEKLKSKEKQIGQMQQLLSTLDGSAGKSGQQGGRTGTRAGRGKKGKASAAAARTAGGGGGSAGEQQTPTPSDKTETALGSTPSTIDSSDLATQITDLETELDELNRTCSALQIKFDLAVEQRNEAQTAEANLRRAKEQLEAELTALQLRYAREKQETTILRRTNHSLRVSIMDMNGGDNQDMAQRLLSIKTDGVDTVTDDGDVPYFRTVAVQVSDLDGEGGSKKRDVSAVSNKKIQCDLLVGESNNVPPSPQVQQQQQPQREQERIAPLQAAEKQPLFSVQQTTVNAPPAAAAARKETVERAVSKPGLPVYKDTRDSVSQTTATEHHAQHNIRRLSRAFSIGTTALLPDQQQQQQRLSAPTSPAQMMPQQQQSSRRLSRQILPHHAATILPTVMASSPSLPAKESSSVDLTANNTVRVASQAPSMVRTDTLPPPQPMPTSYGAQQPQQQQVQLPQPLQQPVQLQQQQQQNITTAGKTEAPVAVQKLAVAAKTFADKAVATDSVPVLQPLVVMQPPPPKEPANLRTSVRESPAAIPPAAAATATSTTQNKLRALFNNTLVINSNSDSSAVTNSAQASTTVTTTAAVAATPPAGVSQQQPQQYQPFTFEMLANEKSLLKMAALEATKTDRAFGLDLFLQLRNERLLASGDAQVQTDPTPKRMQSMAAMSPELQMLHQQRSLSQAKAAAATTTGGGMGTNATMTIVERESEAPKLGTHDAANQAGASTFCDLIEQEAQTDIQMYRKARRIQQQQRADGTANPTTSEGTFFSTDGLTANHATEEILAQLQHPSQQRKAAEQQQQRNMTKAHQIYQLAAQYIDNPQQILPGSLRNSSQSPRLSDALRRNTDTFASLTLNSKPEDGPREYRGFGVGINPIKLSPTPGMVVLAPEKPDLSAPAATPGRFGGLSAAFTTTTAETSTAANRGSSNQEKLQQFLLSSPISRSPPIKPRPKEKTELRRNSGGGSGPSQPFDLNAVTRLSSGNNRSRFSGGGGGGGGQTGTFAAGALPARTRMLNSQSASEGSGSASQSTRTSKRFASAPPHQQQKVLGGLGQARPASSRVDARGGKLSSAIREVVEEILPLDSDGVANTSPTFRGAGGRRLAPTTLLDVGVAGHHATTISAASSRPASASQRQQYNGGAAHALQPTFSRRASGNTGQHTIVGPTQHKNSSTLHQSGYASHSPPVRKLPNVDLNANFDNVRKK